MAVPEFPTSVLILAPRQLNRRRQLERGLPLAVGMSISLLQDLTTLVDPLIKALLFTQDGFSFVALRGEYFNEEMRFFHIVFNYRFSPLFTITSKSEYFDVCPAGNRNRHYSA
jgi:hypothetical protein